MTKSEDIKIKAGDQNYKDHSIKGDVEKINKDENLADELGIFRLASVHRDLDLANQPPSNAVLVNLRIKFITKTDVEAEHVIPVMVTQGDDQEAITCYSGSKVNKKEFSKFYQSIKPEVTATNRQSYYHSEPFLAYYLCSEDGKKFLVKEFKKKGLIVDGDGEGTHESNLKEVVSIGMDLHSTKVVCYNCGPFLKAAVHRLLESINSALVLPKNKRPQAIEFNVSANQNFNWNNISRADTFDHIPVLESEKKNILTNTEEILRDFRARLQKVGEVSNRTFFLSGSGSVDSDVMTLKYLDEKRWHIVTTAASVEIQRMWRGFKERNNIYFEIDRSQKESEERITKLRKIVATTLRLPIFTKINDLLERIEDSQITIKEAFKEIDILYDQAKLEGLIVADTNHENDKYKKLDTLFDIQKSREKLNNKKSLAKLELAHQEKELENIDKKRILLKKLWSSKQHNNQEKPLLEQDLDIFNYVGESSNLSHQNLLYLINQAFKSSALDASQTAVAVISEDDSLDHCLRDEILKFIGKEPVQDKISIALCRGHLNGQSGQIEGNTHWTALHLRRIENEDGTILIKTYHMDSMGGGTPRAVKRVLESIKKTALEDLGDDLSASATYQLAIERLDNANFSQCKILERPTKQTDGYSCGYHAVFNMIRMHNLKRVANATGHSVTYEYYITQDKKKVAIDQFISDNKANLQNHFNSAIDGRLRKHAKFSADMDLNRALSESILISDDDDLDKLKKIIQLEKEIKKSEKEPATVLSSLNFEKFYKKLLSQSVEQIIYKFLVTEEYKAGNKDDVKKKELILEKLSNSKIAQNPQGFLEILEKIVVAKQADSLSSSLDEILEVIGKVEKEQSAEDSLTKNMAKVSLEDKETKGLSPKAPKAKALLPTQLGKDTHNTKSHL